MQLKSMTEAISTESGEDLATDPTQPTKKKLQISVRRLDRLEATQIGIPARLHGVS